VRFNKLLFLFAQPLDNCAHIDPIDTILKVTPIYNAEDNYFFSTWPKYSSEVAGFDFPKFLSTKLFNLAKRPRWSLQDLKVFQNLNCKTFFKFENIPLRFWRIDDFSFIHACDQRAFSSPRDLSRLSSNIHDGRIPLHLKRSGDEQG